MSSSQFEARINVSEFQKQLESLRQEIADVIRGKPALLYDLEQARGARDVIVTLMKHDVTELPKWMLDAHVACAKAALIEARKQGQDAEVATRVKACRLLQGD